MHQTNRLSETSRQWYIQDWFNQLDQLSKEGREFEVDQVYRSIELAFFGAINTNKFVDVLIHKKAATLYFRIKSFEKAIEQLKLALAMVPADVELLHVLALTYLEENNYKECSNVIKQVENLEPDIIQWHSDWAGLQGRLLRTKWKMTSDKHYLEEALEVYETSFDHNPFSFYMADAAGQVSLQLEQTERAVNHFKNSVNIIRELKQQTLWSHASTLTALIVIGKEGDIENQLYLMKNLNLSSRSIATLERTIDDINLFLKLPKEKIAGWVGILKNN